MPLGNHLKQARRRKGITQAILADRVGVSRQAIGAIENGLAVPSVLLALSLAAALEMPIDRLFWLQDRARNGMKE